MVLRYRVRHLFSLEGTEKVYTNDDEAEIKALPRATRDELIAAGSLLEWDDHHGDTPPAEVLTAAAEAEANPTRGSRARKE